MTTTSESWDLDRLTRMLPCDTFDGHPFIEHPMSSRHRTLFGSPTTMASMQNRRMEIFVSSLYCGVGAGAGADEGSPPDTGPAAATTFVIGADEGSLPDTGSATATTSAIGAEEVHFVVGDNEPSSAPIADVVAVAEPVSGNEPSSAPIANVVAAAGPVSGGEPSSAPAPSPQ
ncbi:hypothetical protein V6N13_107464 [Hibiscus sabdariffa]